MTIPTYGFSRKTGTMDRRPATSASDAAHALVDARCADDETGRYQDRIEDARDTLVSSLDDLFERGASEAEIAAFRAQVAAA